MKRFLRYILIGLVCIGCNSDLPNEYKNLDNVKVLPAGSEPVTNIDFKKEIEFGNNNETTLGYIQDIAVDKNGNIYIADSQQANIKIFDTDGNLDKTLGRKGEGSKEFINLQDIRVHNSKLYALDYTKKQIIVFSLDSSKVITSLDLATNKDDIPELDNSHFAEFYLRSDSTFLISFYKNSLPNDKKEWSKAIRTQYWYIIDQNGKIISEKLHEMKSAVRTFITRNLKTVDRETGLYGKALVSVASNNNIYSSWSEHFLIKSHDLQWNYQNAFYYPHKRIPLTEESAKEAGIPKIVIDGMSKMDLPTYWPAIDKLLTDSKDRLWVSTIISDQSKRNWHILKKDGSLLSDFTWPVDKKIEIVKNNHILVQETDPKTNSQKITRYEYNLINS